VSGTLLLLSIGPVQQFIGQARRMRDLWLGSHVLSEMSRAAARSLAEADWELVLPALEKGDPELEPCLGTTRPETGLPPLGISNKVLATRGELPDESILDAARTARRAAVAVWKHFAAGAVARAGNGLLASPLAEHEDPEAVVESLLELVAGWARFGAEGGFEAARLEAEQAIAARKALRDFRQWQGGPYPKSSLDGQRESILIDRQKDDRGERPERPFGAAGRLRLSPREHLDGVGLVKRAGGEPDQFVPVARVAVEPWLQALYQAAKGHQPLGDRLAGLEDACRRAHLTRCDHAPVRWLRGAFPYDGEIFFEGQWPALIEELGLDGFFESRVKPLFRGRLAIPAPYPYVACLAADGDRMGAALSALATASRQSKLSTKLAGFSRSVRTIVEDHRGIQVFAGGDDVLAVLPVATAVPCAEALHGAFEDAVRDLFDDPSQAQDQAPPTLSVGIGVGHYLNPLGALRDLARQAEKYAKVGDGLPEGDPGQRNALAVIVDKRSGGTVRWRGQWDKEGQGPGARLLGLMDHLRQGRMPKKLPYELDKVVQALADLPESTRTEGIAWRLEVLRILGRRRPEGLAGKIEPEDIGLDLPTPDEIRVGALRDKLGDWVGAALVAAALADALRNPDKVAARALALESHHDH
jgi:CRISPR-associated protein Cmr2